MNKTLIAVIIAAAALPAAAQELGQAFQAALGTAAAAHKAAAPPALPFSSKSKKELKNGEGVVWATVETGQSGALPATRFTTKFDHETVLIAQAGKARSADEARAACQAKAPAGRWNLPEQKDYLVYLMAEAVKVEVKLPGGGYYPMWLQGASQVVGMRDGTGQDMFPLPTDAESVAGMKRELEKAEEALRKGAYRTDKEQRTVDAALKAYQEATRTWLNPDIPHPRELSPEVNGILAKPSKKRVTEQRDTLKTIYGTVKDGYPVHCVAKT